MTFKHTSLLTVIILVIFSSCVSNKKYLSSVAYSKKLQGDSSQLSKDLAALRSKSLNQEETINKLELLNKNQKDKILQQEDIAKKAQSELENMIAANKNANSQLTQSQKQVAEQQKRLMQLQGLIDQQKKNTEDLRKKISAALVDFNSSQLTVSMKNGRVYVSMQESLLFPSGSAEVNPNGKTALSTLAQVLNQNQDINVNVEGHTDSIPISKRYEDNWALSVARSTAISRILINDYKVSPARITSSGRSQYAPIDENSTPEGRAHNRRTEIILEPKLDRLMELIRSEQ
jgi:chemotaxis protein MotB